MISALSKSHLSVIGDKCLDIMSLISLALLTSKRGGPITVFYCQSSTSMEIRAALLAERRNSSLTDHRKGRRGRTEISAGIRCCISCMLCLFILKKKPRCFQGQDNNGDRSRSCISADPAPNRWRFRNKCHYSLTKVGLYDLTYTVPLHKFQIRLQYTCTKHMAIST